MPSLTVPACVSNTCQPSVILSSSLCLCSLYLSSCDIYTVRFTFPSAGDKFHTSWHVWIECKCNNVSPEAPSPPLDMKRKQCARKPFLNYIKGKRVEGSVSVRREAGPSLTIENNFPFVHSKILGSLILFCYVNASCRAQNQTRFCAF